jgi:hypothetical protein
MLLLVDKEEVMKTLFEEYLDSTMDVVALEEGQEEFLWEDTEHFLRKNYVVILKTKQKNEFTNLARSLDQVVVSVSCC